MSKRNFRIVAYAPNPWRGPWMNRQQLLSRLGRQVPVLYSTGSFYSWERHTQGWKCAPIAGRFEFEDGVWLDVPPRVLLRWLRHRVWDRAVLNIQARRIRRFSESLGDGILIGYAFGPAFADDLEALDPDICVYHAYDLFASTPGWNEAHAHQERRLLSRADLVVASSDVIADGLRSQGVEDVVVIPNGADVRAFAADLDESVPEPEDIAGIPHPRIGYVGNLNRKVDFPLVEDIARGHAGWQFVFVGGLRNLDDLTGPAAERCKALANVHFLGEKEPSGLPAYMNAMDVNIMCYRTDAGVWTQGVYPLKLHEYLAVGKPVVSADIPSVSEYANVIAIVKGQETWETCLQSAIDGHGIGTVGARRAVASQNDWDVRVSVLMEQLDRLEKAKR